MFTRNGVISRFKSELAQTSFANGSFLRNFEGRSFVGKSISHGAAIGAAEFRNGYEAGLLLHRLNRALRSRGFDEISPQERAALDEFQISMFNKGRDGKPFETPDSENIDGLFPDGTAGPDNPGLTDDGRSGLRDRAPIFPGANGADNFSGINGNPADPTFAYPAPVFPGTGGYDNFSGINGNPAYPKFAAPAPVFPGAGGYDNFSGINGNPPDPTFAFPAEVFPGPGVDDYFSGINGNPFDPTFSPDASISAYGFANYDTAIDPSGFAAQLEGRDYSDFPAINALYDDAFDDIYGSIYDSPTDIFGVGLNDGSAYGGSYTQDLEYAYSPYDPNSQLFSEGDYFGYTDTFDDFYSPGFYDDGGGFDYSYDYTDPSSYSSDFSFSGGDYYGYTDSFDSFYSAPSYDYSYDFYGGGFSYDYGGFDYGGGFSFTGGFEFPVILDLDGDGIDVTPLTSSNMFFDMSGDGYQNRTAWAAAGDAILAIDADGDGEITERNEIVFTDWDPTAADDLTALRNVFDTNGSGTLDAGDDRFANFYLLLTNIDGTTSLQTLTEADIATIGLIPDASQVLLRDGSIIDGKATFTRGDGSTGAAATAVLRSEAASHVVEETAAENADGSTMITSRALDAAGAIAYELVQATSADGNTRTLSLDDNGDGVIDVVQTTTTVVNGDGSTTETMTNETAAGVLLSGETTDTSSDGATISISRDMDGDGLADQTEVRTTDANGATSIAITDLNVDGSTVGSTTVATSSDGLTRTNSSDFDGDGNADLVETDATVVNANGSRTETVSQTNQDGSLRQKTTTSVSADGLTSSRAIDANGDGTDEIILASSVVQNANNTVSTETETGGDGTLIGETVTTVSSDGLARTVVRDITGDGVVDETTTDVTVVNADGSREETVSEFSGDGSLLQRIVTDLGADGRSRTVEADGDGDGSLDVVQTIVVNGSGEMTATESLFNGDGSLNSETVTTTSADGLTETTTIDLDGDGVVDGSTSITTVINGDGSSTTTETSQSGDDTQLTKRVTTTSANGLSITVSSDTDGDGTFETTLTDNTVINADGSEVTTETLNATDGSLLSESVTTLSADRKTTTSIVDDNGDGNTDREVSTATQADGTTIDTISRLKPNGSLIEKSVISVSDDNLAITTEFDENGDGTFDLTTTDVAALNADGSRTTTATEKNADGSVRAQTETTISDDGYETSVASDLDGNSTFDTTVVTESALNADGSVSTTVETTNADGSLRNSSLTEIGGTGLATTTQTDLDGDGAHDRLLSDTQTIAADGSRTETVTERYGDGSLRSEQVTTTSADGRSVTITRDTDGDGNLDETQSIVLGDDGVSTDELTRLNADGSVRDRFVETVSADGLTITNATDENGDGTLDVSTTRESTINADGSTSRVRTTHAGTTLSSTQTVITSADGRTTTTTDDFDGDGTVDLSSSSVLEINEDGSRVENETFFYGDGSVRDSTVTTTSADGRTITVSADTLGDIDPDVTETLRRITQIEADGDEVVTITYPNTEYDQEVDTRIVSADGLSSSILIDEVDFEWIDIATVTTLNSDGSRTEVFTNEDIIGLDVETTTSANGLVRNVEMSGTPNDLDPDLAMSASDVTALQADGSTVRTITNTITQANSDSSGGTSVRVITTSDDGLSTTSELDIDNDGQLDRIESTVTGVDGSITETITLNDYVSEALVSHEVRETSADGRSQSLDRDRDGDSVFDHFETTVTNADGSVTQTTWRTDASGTLEERVVVEISATGLSESLTIDSDGDGVIDLSQLVETVINADGTRLTTASDFFGDAVLRSRAVTTRSANGFNETTEFDLDGDGVVDEILATTTTFGADGDVERVTTETYADGSLKSEITNTVDRATYNSDDITDFDTDGDGVVDRQVLVGSFQDGYRNEITTYYNADGSQKSQVANVNSPDGLEELIYYGGVEQEAPNEGLYFMPGANESYLWYRFTNAEAQTSTHTIDFAGVDHWTWANQDFSVYEVNPKFFTTRIDLDTEQELIEKARRLYDTAFDRTMLQREAQVLAGYISDGGVLDTTAMANDLMASDEFKDRYGSSLTELHFVQRIYRNAFGRHASLAELSQWVGALEAGTVTRADVMYDVSESLEHLAVGNVHAITNNTHSGEADVLDHTTDKMIAGHAVRLFYEVALAREATEAEVDTHANDIVTGAKSQLQVATAILALPEFGSTYGDLSNAEFVETVFVNALNRAPTASEESFWTAAVDAGTVSRADLTLSVAHSAENRTVPAAPSVLDGDDADNVLIGGGRNDQINGYGGADTLRGGGGHDTLDGGAGNDTLEGAGGNDTLIGGPGNDSINGGVGNDAIDGGSGNDTINGDDGDDTYTFGRGDGVDTIADSYDTEETTTQTPYQVTIYTKRYSDGRTRNLGTNYSGPMRGSSGGGEDGTITWNVTTHEETRYNTTVVPAGTIAGGVNDVLRFGAGIAIADIVFEVDGNDLIIGVLPEGYDRASAVPAASSLADHMRLTDHLNLGVIDRFEFDDGVLVVGTDIDESGRLTLTATPEGSQLTGASGDDTLVGDAGNDTLDGGAGNDTLTAAAGDDTVISGLGDDIIDGGVGNDVLDGGRGNDTINGGDGDDVYTFGRGDGIDTVADTYLAPEQTIQEAYQVTVYTKRYSDGRTKNLGTNYTGRMSGSSGGGGEGDTRVTWRVTTHEETRHRTVTIRPETVAGGTNDVLRFGAGITTNDVVFEIDGDDLVVGVLPDDFDQSSALPAASSLEDHIRLSGQETLGVIDRFEFDDGTVLLSADIEANGGAAVTALSVGSRLSDSDRGETLLGGTGDDELGAGAGDDIIDAGAGDDVLIGGLGNDTLTGGAGNDVYQFNIGDGQDTIQNNDASAATEDTLEFGVELDAQDVWFARDGDSLAVSLLGHDDQVSFTNWYTDDAAKIDAFAVADGSRLLAADVNSLVNAMAAFSPSTGDGSSGVTPDTLPNDVQLAINAAWSQNA